MKAVLRRLYSYARHPSSFKRLGAALGFNHIYTVLRSVTVLIICRSSCELCWHYVFDLFIRLCVHAVLGWKHSSTDLPLSSSFWSAFDL